MKHFKRTSVSYARLATQMYEELKDLLRKDREQSVLKKKHKRSLPRLKYQLSKRNGKRPKNSRG